MDRIFSRLPRLKNDMKKYLLGTLFLSFVLQSCNYDPFYYGTSSTSFGVTSMGGGYSSSFFVSTGDPRWAYDPYRYCYFDRYRSCYYDPFLYGYYPVGYCPVPVRGCPHPYNWSGVGICPPPRTIRSQTLSHYDHRVSNYQAANYHWARKVNSSGSSSWLSSNERAQMSQQASSPTFSHLPSSSSNTWMGSGLRESNQSGRISTSRETSSERSSTRSWMGGSLPSSRVPSPPPPSIEPRPVSGGMFGGLNRGNQGTSSLRNSSVAPSQPAARAESAAPAQTERVQSRAVDENNSSSGSASPGGGLRRFQR